MKGEFWLWLLSTLICLAGPLSFGLGLPILLYCGSSFLVIAGLFYLVFKSKLKGCAKASETFLFNMTVSGTQFCANLGLILIGSSSVTFKLVVAGLYTLPLAVCAATSLVYRLPEPNRGV